MSETQNLKNHARSDPAYHFLLFGIYLLNLIYAGFHLYRQPSLSSGGTWCFHWLRGSAVKLRTYPLKVQDRVIRLEERLRLKLWHHRNGRLDFIAERGH